jgi:hypothetical protein
MDEHNRQRWCNYRNGFRSSQVERFEKERKKGKRLGISVNFLELLRSAFMLADRFAAGAACI